MPMAFCKCTTWYICHRSLSRFALPSRAAEAKGSDFLMPSANQNGKSRDAAADIAFALVELGRCARCNEPLTPSQLLTFLWDGQTRSLATPPRRNRRVGGLPGAAGPAIGPTPHHLCTALLSAIRSLVCRQFMDTLISLLTNPKQLIGCARPEIKSQCNCGSLAGPTSPRFMVQTVTTGKKISTLQNADDAWLRLAFSTH